MGSDEDKAAIVRTCWRHWAARDRISAVALLSPDVFYGLYVPEDVLPFGGETRGKPSVSDRLQTILDLFHTIRFEPEVTKVDGDEVHGRVAYCFRHKITGEDIDGVLRQVFEVRDGLIAGWREYTDLERVRAFMRLVAYTASERQLEPPEDA